MNRSQGMMSAAVAAAMLAAAGLTLASPGLAKPDESGAGSLVADAMAREGPIITDAERAVIREKCGETDPGRDSITLSSSDGLLTCENGRKVDDPEVRAIVTRVGERARTHVAAAMDRTEVREAIRGDAMAKAGEHLRRFDPAAQRQHVEQALEAARAALAHVDIAAVSAAAAASAQAAMRAHGRLSDADRTEIRAALEAARAELAQVDVDAAMREADAELARELKELRRRTAD